MRDTAFRLLGPRHQLIIGSCAAPLKPVLQPSTELEAISTSSATTGNLFRSDATSGQYIFNLATKTLSAGTYQLSIDLGDGLLRTVNISLK